MPFIRTWNRLEPLARHKELSDGLEARLADPLWMLGRQWQFGEFKGSDGGTPVLARFEADRAELQRYQAGIGGNTNPGSEPYEPLLEPLEVHVEMEVQADERGLRFWLNASGQLRKILKRRNVSATTLVRLRDAYPLLEENLLPGTLQTEIQQMQAHALISLTGGKAMDAKRYHAESIASLANANPRLPDALAALPATEANKVEAGTREWLADIIEPQTADESAWQPDQLEYAFAAAADLNGEVVLEAAEYGGGRLDWHAFDARRDRFLCVPAGGTQRVIRTALPVPVEYGGMPADRYWAYEDHPVRFGQIATSKTDLARLLMAEFALVYGNDWFVVPIELPLGSLIGNSRITVTDSFGAAVEISPERHPETTLFQLSSNRDDASGLFLLAPVLTDSDSGEPQESVMIVRDELANLVWGVEQRVPDQLGGSRNRNEEPPGAAGSATLANMPEEAELIYRLNSTVPANWIPYVPVRIPASTASKTVLEQRIIESLGANGDRSKVPPQGVILKESTHINQEEATREGVIVERQKQLTRWVDGSYHLWIGRRKRVGRGEGSSGLRYDFTEEV